MTFWISSILFSMERKMAYKVKYGESWQTLETKYPGIKQANPSIRTPKAGVVLNTVNNPYQYTSVSSYAQPTVKQTVSPTTVPTTNKVVKQTVSPTSVPTTNKVVKQTVSPTVVPTTTGNTSSIGQRLPDSMIQEAVNAVNAAEAKKKAANSSQYYWINGKRHKKNIVILNAKGKPIHNWNALAGNAPKTNTAAEVFEPAVITDYGTIGQFHWSI